MLRRILSSCFIAAFAAAASAQQQVTVFSQTVPLDPRNSAMQQAGELDYRGGVALCSTDARFGGFSGLHISTGGATLLAISDRGA